jgi:thymidylate synthase (FAD)
MKCSAERLIEFAGRVCYLSFGSGQGPGTNAGYIRKLISNQHESVLEHASWSVLITGVSRAFTHQLVRHRVGFAFSQLSQQYHDESNVEFVRPHGLDAVPGLLEIWEAAMRQSKSAYRKIISELGSQQTASPQSPRREILRGLRSAARSVLPNATETAIVATINARAPTLS